MLGFEQAEQNLAFVGRQCGDEEGLAGLLLANHSCSQHLSSTLLPSFVQQLSAPMCTVGSVEARLA